MQFTGELLITLKHNSIRQMFSKGREYRITITSMIIEHHLTACDFLHKKKVIPLKLSDLTENISKLEIFLCNLHNWINKYVRILLYFFFDKLALSLARWSRKNNTQLTHLHIRILDHFEMESRTKPNNLTSFRACCSHTISTKNSLDKL